MNPRIQKWFYGLGSAFIGGGASAITCGLTSMGFAPDRFNLQNSGGFLRLLGLMGANFLVSGFLSCAFYLRQSPLPPEPTGQTDFIKAPQPQITVTNP